MRFSVVIPTYNRGEKLIECLEALFNQAYNKKEFEIVVMDDGSQDDTQKILKKLQKESPVSLRVFHQSNQGQGVARNRGIAESVGEIILFIGDDIVVIKDFLKAHDDLHIAHPEWNAGVLGFITWHPKIPMTPLMKFAESAGAIFGKVGGHQFGFDLLEGKETADYRFFYTSNISLKREILERFKFDPWFSGYGWEDIELGYRITKHAGFVLYYEPSAIAYHDHPMSSKQWADRMKEIGYSSQLLHSKYPELVRVPTGKKLIIFKILANRLTIWILKHLNQNWYFYALSKRYFLQGLYNKK
jgi:glycosyltransferase involved in cell wall biosynthesis